MCTLAGTEIVKVLTISLTPLFPFVIMPPICPPGLHGRGCLLNGVPSVHEHGLGDLLLTGLHDRLAALAPGSGLRVRVRVSEISGLTPDALQQALDHACEHHGVPPIALDLLSEGLLGRCPTCECAVRLNDDLACSGCGDTRATICAGETLLIEEVTVCPAEECTGG